MIPDFNTFSIMRSTPGKRIRSFAIYRLSVYEELSSIVVSSKHPANQLLIRVNAIPVL